MSSSESMSSTESEDMPRVQSIRKPRKSKGIALILQKVSFPDHIKKQAIAIYDTLQVENHKSTKKRKLACYCVYKAYLIFRQNKKTSVDIIEIGHRLGLTAAESRSCINSRPEYKTGFKPHKSTLTYEDRIRSYIVEDCNMGPADADGVVEDFAKLLETDPSLKTRQSQTLIAGFIMYWMPLNSYQIDDKKLADDFGLSQGAIKFMCGEVKKSSVLYKDEMSD